jgi:hypothetical protein
MADKPEPVHDARETAIAELSEQFAHDNLDMEEFERRVTLAHRASSVTELRDLVRDLPGGTTLATRTASTAIVPETQVRPEQTLAAIFGGVERAGTWTVARHVKVRAIMGGAQLDFRDARLGLGVTTVEITAVMGGVDIIVPPELAVEIDGTAIFGGFAHMERAPRDPDPNKPVLRVTGFAFMGGVSVRTRLVGESDRQARRRDRLERREHRRLERSERKLLRERNR